MITRGIWRNSGAVILLLLAAAQSHAAEKEPPVNVVLLSVDTLRADRLGCYGYTLPTSPHIDAFAAEGLVFDDTVCEVPLTMPSMGSMLTSRPPRSTGTTRNGLRMPEDVVSIAEIFQEAGYYTFCVQSNWTLKSKLSGLNRGFDVYDDDFHKKRWGFIKAERIADEVTDIALKELARRDPERPFFAWFHYTDPHAPYTMHKDFNPLGRRVWTLGRERKTWAKYDSEVAFTDHHIGRLLEALPSQTAVLFVADHGESLFEHDYLGHGRRLYHNGMQIPLIIRAPGLAAGRTAAPACGLDVGPTLLGLAKLPRPEAMLGLDLLQSPPAITRVRVFETYGGAIPRLPGARSLLAGSDPIRQGVIVEGWKLIVSGRQKELFFLPEDPGELKNLSSRHPERVKTMQTLIEEWNRVIARVEESPDALDEDDIRALESLGYIE